MLQYLRDDPKKRLLSQVVEHITLQHVDRL